MKSPQYEVVVKERKTNIEVEAVECGSLEKALRVERGMNINLNREDYYTTIRSKEQKKT